MTIEADELRYLCNLIKSKCGIDLQGDCQYLVISRLEPIAKKYGFRDISEMILKVRCNCSDDSVCKEIVEAITTNETLFFRDKLPFEEFKNRLIPELMRSRQVRKKIRIWSAACSSGQEPYSIVMSYLDSFSHCTDWQFEVIATDFNQKMLDKASEGYFSQFEVQRGLSEVHLQKYFTAYKNGWKINESVRSRVKFSRVNLIDSNLGLGVFDIIFCRNVLIYFDSETKKTVFQNLANYLADDGYLFLGGAESPMGFSDLWQRCSAEPNMIVFKKKEYEADYKKVSVE